MSPPRMEKASWIAGVISAVIAILGYLLWPPSDVKPTTAVTQNAHVVGNQIGNVAGDVQIIMDRPKDEPAASKLDRIFTYEMIGGSVTYAESIIGPPIKIVSDEDKPTIRSYKIDTCRVEIGTRQPDVIDSLQLYLSPMCSIRWQSILPGYAKYLPNPENLTFADIQAAGGGRYDNDCLLHCGNTAASRMELRFAGAHSDDNIFGFAGAIIYEDVNVRASSNLSDRLSKYPPAKPGAL